ncbi:MAG: hypothetical protein COV31_00265 [Candidatus Yanofskybacteria bacterium CG10_big_fil_rev_8_21_14_0_10_46_23]|uniref:FAD/NAD(P)-binding domain-containing protein n=1 Tax=Candidatus Yanofskybacteria bacterium CG10_big_fil_rev_8_21_14_0_10_46_23 TaxID=1975098 RepID=A0A2H0R4T0_9BACT|nr:MAG: hypothetical protein COV31_00265 [Candidatus Yanofskybacteria bacterium CG10_big_fil_rev_8_21_14_0_10_46_23]
MNQGVHELIVIGGSAAAATAGIYSARRKLDFKIISKDFGGEVATSGEIGNWPGTPQTNGVELAEMFKNHLKRYDVEPEIGVRVVAVKKQTDGIFCITTSKGETPKTGDKFSEPSTEAVTCDYLAKAVLVATGVHPRELDILGEKNFRNKGVSYCTVCDGPLFQGKTVATIGGGNSALESAIMLAGIAEKVYVLNKNQAFKGDSILIDKLKLLGNVEIIFGAQAKEIRGQDFVEGLSYVDSGGEERRLSVQGIFVHIGMIPNSNLVGAEVSKDKFGHIIVDKNCQTNIPGLFAAGDVTDVPYQQIVIAAGQGACAALSAVSYLNTRA